MATSGVARPEKVTPTDLATPLARSLLRALAVDDPLFLPAVDAATIPSAPTQACRANKIVDYLRFLSANGADPTNVSTRTCEAWLATAKSANVRAQRLNVIRWMYRAACSRGLAIDDPTAGVRYNGPTWADRRLTDADATKVVDAIRRDLSDPLRGLTARRDLVAFGLALSRQLTSRQLSLLKFADVDLSASPRLRWSVGDDYGPLPVSVGEVLRDFRTALSVEGVELVAEDALVPALGNRIYYDWLGDDRAILAPVGFSGICAMVRRRMKAAGVAVHLPGGLTYSRLDWLVRTDFAIVDSIIRGGAAPRRVPTRRNIVSPAGPSTASTIAA